MAKVLASNPDGSAPMSFEAVIAATGLWYLVQDALCDAEVASRG